MRLSNLLKITSCGWWGRILTSVCWTPEPFIFCQPLSLTLLKSRLSRLLAVKSAATAPCQQDWNTCFSAPVVLTEPASCRGQVACWYLGVCARARWLQTFTGKGGSRLSYDIHVIWHSWDYETNRPSTDCPAYFFSNSKEITSFPLVLEAWGWFWCSSKYIFRDIFLAPQETFFKSVF